MKEKDVFKFEYNEHMVEKFGLESLYWCFDGILVAEKRKDDFVLIDTYWLTQPKIMTIDEAKEKGKLEFLFNLDDVVEISQNDLKYYDDKDVYILKMQHGYETKYYLKKNSKKSQKKMIEAINNKITETERKINNLKQQLDVLLSNKKKIESGNLDIYI